MRRADESVRRVRCGGFSLTEVLLATAVTTLVVSQAVVALVSSQRVLEATIADVELSVQARALREKLLFDINEDGGLMNTSMAEVKFENEDKGWGDGLEFKPKKGGKNRLGFTAKKKMKADVAKERWLDCGTMVFNKTEVFGNSLTNGTIRVNIDVVLPVGKRRYSQQHVMESQLMNE